MAKALGWRYLRTEICLRGVVLDTMQFLEFYRRLRGPTFSSSRTARKTSPHRGLDLSSNLPPGDRYSPDDQEPVPFRA